MPQDQELRKVGRGGAGNYYAPHPDDDSSKDLEAQKLESSGAGTIPSSFFKGPTKAGRGGAGNFIDQSPALQQARDQEHQLAAETTAAVKSSLKKHHEARGGLSGRGGAGNFSAHAKAEKEEEEKNKITELERKVKEAVDVGLKMPAKAHHGPRLHEE